MRGIFVGGKVRRMGDRAVGGCWQAPPGGRGDGGNFD